jgi:hypothetical protein
VIYATLPLIAGESVRALRRRALDRRVLYALAIPALAILLTYPPTLRAQQSLLSAIQACPVFWAHPQLRDLKVYAEMVPPFVVLLAVLACVGLLFKLALIGTPREEPASDGPPEDIAVAAMLALFVPVMLLVTHFGTKLFQVPLWHWLVTGSFIAFGTSSLSSPLASLAAARVGWGGLQPRPRFPWNAVG